MAALVIIVLVDTRIEGADANCETCVSSDTRTVVKPLVNSFPVITDQLSGHVEGNYGNGVALISRDATTGAVTLDLISRRDLSRLVR